MFHQVPRPLKLIRIKSSLILYGDPDMSLYFKMILICGQREPDPVSKNRKTCKDPPIKTDWGSRKKNTFFSGPATKALTPPPPLELSGHIF